MAISPSSRRPSRCWRFGARAMGKASSASSICRPSRCRSGCAARLRVTPWRWRRAPSSATSSFHSLAAAMSCCARRRPAAAGSPSSSTAAPRDRGDLRRRVPATSPVSPCQCPGGTTMRVNLARLTVATALLLASTSLSAAFEEGSLLVWINGDKGYDGLQEIGDRFTEELGIEVVVEHPEAVTDKFQQSAATGDGPDIFIWAHDRFGEWAAAGLIAPVDPTAEVREGIFDFAWDAVTFDGQTWGYPIAVEAVGLIYNKDLVETPPESFEEIFEMELPDGVTPILWDYNNAY